MSIKLTKEQETVCNAVVDFASRDTSVDELYICVAGYAGTGKTTVTSEAARRIFAKDPDKEVAFLAPTGKASLVLHDKLKAAGALGHNAFTGTIHSAIYTVDTTQMPVVFERRNTLPYSLIFIDEASMVSQRLFSDLLAFGIKMVFIGDSGQLPPVGEGPFLPLKNTNLVLNTVHRQALDNPIVRIATEVRMGIKIPYIHGSTFAKMPKNSEASKKIVHRFGERCKDDDTSILVGKNSTRVQINKTVRFQLGCRSEIPQSGEKLVCLKNDPFSGLRNGQLVYVDSVRTVPKCQRLYTIKLKEMPGRVFVAYAPVLNTQNAKDLFSAGVVFSQEERSILKAFNQTYPLYFDFGYALSVHKAQGSEWKNVMLLDERTKYQSDEEYRQWLYTGITRAKDKLLIIS